MHELSICKNILTTVLNYHQNHRGQIKSIQLAIGRLSHIDESSLKFNFAVIARHTAAENATLEINKVEGKAKCKTCQKIFSLDHYYDACPSCQQHHKTILQGEEMMITSMELK